MSVGDVITPRPICNSQRLGWRLVGQNAMSSLILPQHSLRQPALFGCVASYLARSPKFAPGLETHPVVLKTLCELANKAHNGCGRGFQSCL
jgi:hypothetical protein